MPPASPPGGINGPSSLGKSDRKMSGETPDDIKVKEETRSISPRTRRDRPRHRSRDRRERRDSRRDRDRKRRHRSPSFSRSRSRSFSRSPSRSPSPRRRSKSRSRSPRGRYRDPYYRDRSRERSRSRDRVRSRERSSRERRSRERSRDRAKGGPFPPFSGPPGYDHAYPHGPPPPPGPGYGDPYFSGPYGPYGGGGYGPPPVGPYGDANKPGRRPGRNRRDDGPPGVSLLVRNVSPEVTTQDLQMAFGRIGDVRDVYIPLDYHSQQPKGFAFVEYATPDQAREARDEMDRFVMKGRELEVVFAQERRKTPNEMRGRVVDGGSCRRGGGGANFKRSSSFERHKRREREQREQVVTDREKPLKRENGNSGSTAP